MIIGNDKQVIFFLFYNNLLLIDQSLIDPHKLSSLQLIDWYTFLQPEPFARLTISKDRQRWILNVKVWKDYLTTKCVSSLLRHPTYNRTMHLSYISYPSSFDLKPAIVLNWGSPLFKSLVPFHGLPWHFHIIQSLL